MTSKNQSLTCAVMGCINNEYNLEKWRNKICDIRGGVLKRSFQCRCKEPYK